VLEVLQAILHLALPGYWVMVAHTVTEAGVAGVTTEEGQVSLQRAVEDPVSPLASSYPTEQE
jgi:hypothetical protein